MFVSMIELLVAAIQAYVFAILNPPTSARPVNPFTNPTVSKEFNHGCRFRAGLAAIGVGAAAGVGYVFGSFLQRDPQLRSVRRPAGPPHGSPPPSFSA